MCLLIKIVSKTDVSAYDIIQNLFPDKSKDFVININEVEIALVKEIKPDTESRDLEKLASSISDTLSSEFYTHCVVGIGTTVTGIKDLARSFKEAQSALEVAKVFDTDRTIVSYDTLLCTDLKKLKSSQVLTSVSLRTQSCSRLLLWLRNTSTQVLQNTDLVKVCPSTVSCCALGVLTFL